MSHKTSIYDVLLSITNHDSTALDRIDAFVRSGNRIQRTTAKLVAFNEIYYPEGTTILLEACRAGNTYVLNYLITTHSQQLDVLKFHPVTNQTCLSLLLACHIRLIDVTQPDNAAIAKFPVDFHKLHHLDLAIHPEVTPDIRLFFKCVVGLLALGCPVAHFDVYGYTALDHLLSTYIPFNRYHVYLFLLLITWEIEYDLYGAMPEPSHKEGLKLITNIERPILYPIHRPWYDYNILHASIQAAGAGADAAETPHNLPGNDSGTGSPGDTVPPVLRNVFPSIPVMTHPHLSSSLSAAIDVDNLSTYPLAKYTYGIKDANALFHLLNNRYQCPSSLYYQSMVWMCIQLGCIPTDLYMIHSMPSTWGKMKEKDRFVLGVPQSFEPFAHSFFLTRPDVDSLDCVSLLLSATLPQQSNDYKSWATIGLSHDITTRLTLNPPHETTSIHVHLMSEIVTAMADLLQNIPPGDIPLSITPADAITSQTGVRVTMASSSMDAMGQQQQWISLHINASPIALLLKQHVPSTQPSFSSCIYDGSNSRNALHSYLSSMYKVTSNGIAIAQYLASSNHGGQFVQDISIHTQSSQQSQSIQYSLFPRLDLVLIPWEPLSSETFPQLARLLTPDASCGGDDDDDANEAKKLKTLQISEQVITHFHTAPAHINTYWTHYQHYYNSFHVYRPVIDLTTIEVVLSYYMEPFDILAPFYLTPPVPQGQPQAQPSPLTELLECSLHNTHLYSLLVWIFVEHDIMKIFNTPTHISQRYTPSTYFFGLVVQALSSRFPSIPLIRFLFQVFQTNRAMAIDLQYLPLIIPLSRVSQFYEHPEACFSSLPELFASLSPPHTSYVSHFNKTKDKTIIQLPTRLKTIPLSLLVLCSALLPPSFVRCILSMVLDEQSVYLQDYLQPTFDFPSLIIPISPHGNRAQKGSSNPKGFLKKLFSKKKQDDHLNGQADLPFDDKYTYDSDSEDDSDDLEQFQSYDYDSAPSQTPPPKSSPNLKYSPPIIPVTLETLKSHIAQMMLLLAHKRAAICPEYASPSKIYKTSSAKFWKRIDEESALCIGYDTNFMTTLFDHWYPMYSSLNARFYQHGVFTPLSNLVDTSPHIYLWPAYHQLINRLYTNVAHLITHGTIQVDVNDLSYSNFQSFTNIVLFLGEYRVMNMPSASIYTISPSSASIPAPFESADEQYFGDVPLHPDGDQYFGDVPQYPDGDQDELQKDITKKTDDDLPDYGTVVSSQFLPKAIPKSSNSHTFFVPLTSYVDIAKSPQENGSKPLSIPFTHQCLVSGSLKHSTFLPSPILSLLSAIFSSSPTYPQQFITQYSFFPFLFSLLKLTGLNLLSYNGVVMFNYILHLFFTYNLSNPSSPSAQQYNHAHNRSELIKYLLIYMLSPELIPFTFSDAYGIEFATLTQFTPEMADYQLNILLKHKKHLNTVEPFSLKTFPGYNRHYWRFVVPNDLPVDAYFTTSLVGVLLKYISGGFDVFGFDLHLSQSFYAPLEYGGREMISRYANHASHIDCGVLQSSFTSSFLSRIVASNAPLIVNTPGLRNEMMNIDGQFSLFCNRLVAFSPHHSSIEHGPGYLEDNDLSQRSHLSMPPHIISCLHAICTIIPQTQFYQCNYLRTNTSDSPTTFLPGTIITGFLTSYELITDFHLLELTKWFFYEYYNLPNIYPVKLQPETELKLPLHYKQQYAPESSSVSHAVIENEEGNILSKYNGIRFNVIHGIYYRSQMRDKSTHRTLYNILQVMYQFTGLYDPKAADKYRQGAIAHIYWELGHEVKVRDPIGWKNKPPVVGNVPMRQPHDDKDIVDITTQSSWSTRVNKSTHVDGSDIDDELPAYDTVVLHDDLFHSYAEDTESTEPRFKHPFVYVPRFFCEEDMLQVLDSIFEDGKPRDEQYPASSYNYDFALYDYIRLTVHSHLSIINDKSSDIKFANQDLDKDADITDLVNYNEAHPSYYLDDCDQEQGAYCDGRFTPAQYRKIRTFLIQGVYYHRPSYGLDYGDGANLDHPSLLDVLFHRVRITDHASSRAMGTVSRHPSITSPKKLNLNNPEELRHVKSPMFGGLSTIQDGHLQYFNRYFVQIFDIAVRYLGTNTIHPEFLARDLDTSAARSHNIVFRHFLTCLVKNVEYCQMMFYKPPQPQPESFTPCHDANRSTTLFRAKLRPLNSNLIHIISIFLASGSTTSYVQSFRYRQIQESSNFGHSSLHSGAGHQNNAIGKRHQNNHHRDKGPAFTDEYVKLSMLSHTLEPIFTRVKGGLPFQQQQLYQRVIDAITLYEIQTPYLPFYYHYASTMEALIHHPHTKFRKALFGKYHDHIDPRVFRKLTLRQFLYPEPPLSQHKFIEFLSGHVMDPQTGLLSLESCPNVPQFGFVSPNLCDTPSGLKNNAYLDHFAAGGEHPKTADELARATPICNGIVWYLLLFHEPTFDDLTVLLEREDVLFNTTNCNEQTILQVAVMRRWSQQKLIAILKRSSNMVDEIFRRDKHGLCLTDYLRCCFTEYYAPLFVQFVEDVLGGQDPQIVQ